MKTYKYKSKYYGFQMSIPEGWSSSLLMDLKDYLSNPQTYWGDSSGKRTDSRTIVGPNHKYQYLNILITPLLENEPEPTLKDTNEFFDSWIYKQNLMVIETGTVKVANKEHFWATYYTNLLARPSQIQFFKKYCLYLNRTEYLFTAGLYRVFPGDKLPIEQVLRDNGKVYDEMILSIVLGND